MRDGARGWDKPWATRGPAAPAVSERRPPTTLWTRFHVFAEFWNTLLFFSKGRNAFERVAAGLAGGFRRARVGPFGLRGDARGRCRSPLRCHIVTPSTACEVAFWSHFGTRAMQSGLE